jgi:hypothetical protein
VPLARSFDFGGCLTIKEEESSQLLPVALSDTTCQWAPVTVRPGQVRHITVTVPSAGSHLAPGPAGNRASPDSESALAGWQRPGAAMGAVAPRCRRSSFRESRMGGPAACRVQVTVEIF